MTLMQPSCKSKAHDILAFYKRVRTDKRLQHEQFCAPVGLKRVSTKLRKAAISAREDTIKHVINQQGYQILNVMMKQEKQQWLHRVVKCFLSRVSSLSALLLFGFLSPRLLENDLKWITNVSKGKTELFRYNTK